MIFRLLARLFSLAHKDRTLSASRLQRVRTREWALVKAFTRRHPHIPLVPHRSGQDDSALGTAHFADLEVWPRRLFRTDHPAVTYVELAFRYRTPRETVHQVNLGRTRLYARIEDPLFLNNRGHTVEQVRARPTLQEAYFRKVFSLMKAQSDCNRALSAWLREFLLPDNGAGEREFLATLQNFNHNIVSPQRPPEAGRAQFRAAMRGFDFGRQTPAFGPVSLRMSVRPHRRDDGRFAQSVTGIFLGNARGLAFRRRNGRVGFIEPGNPFEQRYRAFVDSSAGGHLARLASGSWRRGAEERVWGGPGECEAWFHNHDRFVMKGVQWTLERESDEMPRVLGSHRNVAAYRCGRHRVAVKAVPFESAGDLVRLIQAHQYVHGVQASALLAQARAHPELAAEILTSVTSLLSHHDNTLLDDDGPAADVFTRDWSDLFTRHIGPLLHQVTVDYEHKLLLAVLDWSDEGMLSDFQARKRLLEECSLSHRLRMAANLLRNGLQMLEDDVTHTDLKPENILNLPGAAFRAQQKARHQGWDCLDADELDRLTAGEPTFEGDISGIHFGREGAIDNVARGDGMPTSIHYSSWKFTRLGLSEGTRPTILKAKEDELLPFDALLLEQDIANRGTTIWEIIYGSLVDCIPPGEVAYRVQSRRFAQEQVGKCLDKVIGIKRRGEDDQEATRDLDIAIRQCDRRLLDLVSLRSETIDNKARLTPLFQHARDNRHGLTVWLDPRVIEMLDHLACDFRHHRITRQYVIKLYRTAETLLRAEAGRLEKADRRTARNRRLRMVAYMHARDLHFNPDCGLLGLSELPRKVDSLAGLVDRIPDPRRALNEFAEAWFRVREWGGGVFDALAELHEALDGATTGSGEKGRDELYQLVQSALLQEHETRTCQESRADEERMRPPFLGLLERRRVRVYRDGDELHLSHSVDV